MANRTYGEYIAQRNAGRLFPIYEADQHDLAFEYTMLREFDDALVDYRRDMNRVLGSASILTIPIKERAPRPCPAAYQCLRYPLGTQLLLFELPWWATGAPVSQLSDDE